MKYETQEKRERVLKAGLESFTLYGLKRTTMEDIAQKAGLSRAALYLLFPNKEAIYQALSAQLHEAALDRAEAALQAGGSIEQRLLAAVEARFLELVELVLNSAHGFELAELSGTLGKEILEHTKTRFKAMLTQALQEAEKRGEISFKRVGLEPDQYSELMIIAVNGVKMSAPNIGQYRQQLAQLIGVFCSAVTLETP